jgi:flagellar protein FliS
MKDQMDKQQGQIKLILMLYDGVVKLLEDALNGMKKKQLDRVNDSLIQAQKIITELMLSLDLDVGETALNLFILYDSFHEKLVEANVHKNADLMNDVRETFIGLRKIWEEASLLDVSQIQTQKHSEKQPEHQDTLKSSRKKPNGDKDFGF